VRPPSVDPNRMSETVGPRRITVRVRFPRIAFLFACATSLALPLAAQSPNGTINGLVLDPSNKVIAAADILVINDVTGVKYSGKTNDEGIYVVPNLPPGPYRLQVSKAGFKTLIKPDIVLNIQDALSINFTLPVGAVFETVTVEGGASMINTTDASVSTVVDQTYVKNMPLNGRSFQDLILLTPGVVTNSPQTSSGSAGLGQSGEFSVNGQRTEANNYTVDGVSANVGAASGTAATGQGMTVGAGASGSVPTATALGTTQALVSVDDLQEFRVQSSTYSAEYGRNPGGQFAFETKSGANQWHGTVFDYLRNGALDAQDWFNDYFDTPQPALRQNDFGGTLGGPLEVPRLYDGKNKTFFFVSYEGLRLAAPQAATVNYVPDAALRASAAPAVQQLLNAFPLPSPNGIDDVTNGIAQYIGSWSNPASLDSTSLRFDQIVNDKLRLFFRFSDTGSSAAIRETIAGTPSSNDVSTNTIRTYTGGVTKIFTTRLSNEFRVNYSSNEVMTRTVIDAFAGAVPINVLQLSGLNSGSVGASALVALNYNGYAIGLTQGAASGSQRQWNLVDTTNLSVARHELKVGVDYRRLAPYGVIRNPDVFYYYFSQTDVETNNALSFAQPDAPAYPLYTNFSAFVQDQWRASQRLSVSFGLRWEVNPAPGVTQGLKPYAIQGSGPSTWTLAPQGTPLWQTTWFNLAPRLGAAYVLRNASGSETVVRGGGGVFFDTGQQLGSLGFNGPGFSAVSPFQFGPFPVNAAALAPTIVNPPVSPYSAPAYAFSPHLQLPYTLQWNASVEQSLGKSQALTISYVGSHAARLLQENYFFPPNNPNLQPYGAYVIQNGLTSDYHAMQIQLRRRLGLGLSALASYTWSHCIDYGSENFNLAYQRGDCDFDVRHNLSAALSYDLPNVGHNGLVNTLLNHWGVDGRLTVRTAFPVTLRGNGLFQPNGQFYDEGLSLVPGQPVYLYGANCTSVLQASHRLKPGEGCPGGRAINPNAFVNVASGLGDAPRNFARGFGASQMDLAVRRDFPIHERLKLQFRAEAFNMLNHPNFGSINPFLGQTSFGQATATLASSLGVLTPLYQQGGPRSMQFALKLVF
jgi:hypothetical protein